MENVKREMIEGLKEKAVYGLASFFESDRGKAFYGGGNQARICYDMCKKLDIEIEAFICNEKSNRNLMLPQSIPEYTPKEYALCGGRNKDILLALNAKHNAEITDNLSAEGFRYIYSVKDWNKVNEIFRRIYLEQYFKEKTEGKIDLNREVIEWKGFKICNYKNQSSQYSSMLEGEFFDIIAPPLFDEYRYVDEGEYENQWVEIEKGDIVLDMGANIGMFSCVAAWKGAKVYAFEPTPEIIVELKMNAALYDTIIVEEYAVSDENGESQFYAVNLRGDNFDSGKNTLLQGRYSPQKVSIQTVKTITVDSFVEENKLEHVDFIKADIEGAERLMLKGARKTLQKYAPKLSLCTYHLPDDPQVMERLILEANPNYIVVQGKHKLYAYVPK